MNRRGQFFGFYLVFVTLLMCGVVLFVRYSGADDVRNSLVSPREVLEVRDDLENFELQEKIIVEEIFEDGIDVDVFREKFFEKFWANDAMVDFVFEGLFWNGNSLERGKFDEKSFVENVLYPESMTYWDGDVFNFGRSEVGKEIRLESLKKSEVAFAVDFEFVYGKKSLRF